MNRKLAMICGIFPIMAGLATLAPATSAWGQGAQASLSDAGIQVKTLGPAAELPSQPGVRATLSDWAGSPVLETVNPPGSPAASEESLRSARPLPKFAAKIDIPFAEVAAQHRHRRGARRAVAGAAPIQTRPSESAARPIRPTSLETDLPAIEPQRVNRIARESFAVQEPSGESELTLDPARETAAAANVAADGPLPQMRAMFSFSTTGAQAPAPQTHLAPPPAPTVQAVATRQVPVAGLPAMLKISVDGPRSVAAGETATFSLTTENVGNAAAHHVYLSVDAGREAQIVSCDPPASQQQTSTAQIYLGTLEGGSLRAVSVQITARQAGEVRLRCRTTVGAESHSAELPGGSEPVR